MTFDFTDLAPGDRYKLLTGVIVPRPIAFVTSQDERGRVNAAPFSYFNTMGADPPVVVIGPGDRGPDRPKDTARNIAATRQFVVNLVDEALVERMNLAATDFPPEVSEVDALGLATAPSVRLDVPRLADAPASLECTEVVTLTIGHTRMIVGQVHYLHIRDDLIDPERLYVRTDRLHLVGRMQGHGYVRTRDRFELERLSYAEWLAREAERARTGSES
ncbi:MAG: flavin reductase family protein [Bacteroidetes bacterium]|nr:MAG: flavin reductase family protein [Bacteroidota bacterium]